MTTTTARDRAAAAHDAAKHGLYRPDLEHDACGVGFVARLGAAPSHDVVQKGLTILENLTHRGGAGVDRDTGDGAGMLLALPHALFARAAERLAFELPDEGGYGVGMVFLPRDERARARCRAVVDAAARDEGLTVLGWRKVPVDESACGPSARDSAPVVEQVFLGGAGAEADAPGFERRLYIVRRRIENEVRRNGLAPGGFHVVSFSSRTIAYKGLLLPSQLPRYYLDLRDPLCASRVALVHQRFSTNTFPSWDRAHPYRFLAHNGEINTLRGNVNWMRARQDVLRSALFGADYQKLLPIVDEGGSDSQIFDNVLELLVHAGRSLPHALLMMIPEAWQQHAEMSDELKDFYAYHGCLMEPWDGPAAIAFTDGRYVGATLDRNGLRPGRWTVCDDGLVVMASEAGVLPLDPARVVTKGRLKPGKMFLVDLHEGRIVPDDELKSQLAKRRPYGKWLREHLVPLETIAPVPFSPPGGAAVRTLQKLFGFTQEDVETIVEPMAKTGEEPIGSMGNDAALAVLSDKPQLLFSYFRQLFAQVTNPPIDPLRESLVMSVRSTLGERGNLLDETAQHARQLLLERPVLTTEELARVQGADQIGVVVRSLSCLYDVEDGGAGLERALDALCRDACAAVRAGAQIVVLHDRGADAKRAPIPSLLATSAVHARLVGEGLRTRCGIVVDSGEPREVHHVCLLVGYGATAVHPWLVYETIADRVAAGAIDDDVDHAVQQYVKACTKGVLKVLSKMGISTLHSYRGAQIFEAIGLKRTVVDAWFPGTLSRIEGIGTYEMADDVWRRHHGAFAADPAVDVGLDPGGFYKLRRRGEKRLYSPDVVALLQHSVRANDPKLFAKYAAAANDEATRLATLRGLLTFRPREPVPLDEVEPATSIVKRFKTGAMSLGSLSREAHETLAVAMNRIGGRSNSGEGGEDPARYRDERRSAIKQVASARFGVTIEYLVNADELQIKIAQGAKPGEGGQLPGHKVDAYIAAIRCSTPGVGLISPPPHHDIYSIEDLAQLIHDLKSANPRARVSVKLVSEVGVGTIAAGVAKAKADVILISGDSGGTGASPLSSIKHAGSPWELGLAEAHQTLVVNGLRGRVRLETDGQLKTGRDVAVAALLGAEEFGFATAALVAAGCVMMRVCHSNTCPVGVATQDPELRARFEGKPEHVVSFMMFVAEDLRRTMASIGFRTVDEMVGRVDALEARDVRAFGKARGLDLSPLLHAPRVDESVARRRVEDQEHAMAARFDQKLVELCAPALDRGEPVEVELPVRNVHRSVCTLLSSEVARRFGAAGVRDGLVKLRFEGTAGQSFGAFLAPGLDVRLEGEANDAFGKGLSGGRLVVVPPRASTFAAEEQVIVGNVAFYGATAGESFIRGRAGERFCVRNSGARVVVEGVGDHGCEYMTRGLVIVLGRTGRNFAAGMSGGVAYVLDVDGRFERRVNGAMVDLEAPDDEALEEVRARVALHQELTGSAVAWRLLSRWPDEARRIVVVMPRDERRAREERRARDEAAALQARSA
jgi:glutamate synthase (NADPH) large chain